MFSVAGCTGALDSDTNDTPTTPNTSDTVACSTENPGPWGDAVAKEEVKDGFGEYCHVTIGPDSDALKYDASKVDTASLEKYEFTEEDAKKAQKSAVTFLAEQTLDSTKLDNYEQSDMDWYKNNKDYISPDAKIDTMIEDGTTLVNSGVLVSEYLPQNVKRNGDPRAETITVQVNKISATESNGTPIIIVETGATSIYNPSNEKIVDTILKNDSSKTKETLKQSNPELFEKAPVSLILNGTFNYAFTKDSKMDSISGFGSNWTITTGEGNIELT